MDYDGYWKDRLLHAGLRITAPRLTVLSIVGGVGKHHDADSIAKAAREALGTLSTQAVYDNLHALVAAGLIRKIEPAGHPARYEARVRDNHHHVVCRSCGRTEDVDCAIGHSPCLTPCEDHGFAIDEAEVIFWGICPSCKSTN